MSRVQFSGREAGTAVSGTPAGRGGVLEAHRQAGRHFEAAGVRSFVREQGTVWARDDPTMTLAVYGEKARAAAGLERVRTVPGKHFPQEDQAPAIAQKIAEFALAAWADPG